MPIKLTFEEVCEVVMNHCRERKWDQTNTPRSLAISLSLEANELLEYYQWQDETFGTTTDLAGELADIFIYAIQFAHKNEIDIVGAIQAKIEAQAEKYPAQLFQIEDPNERSKAWLAAKRRYKRNSPSNRERYGE